MIYPNNITFSEDDFKPAGYDIFHDIKRQIINGDLSPGDHLPGERSLMEVYHRSRATVREALHLLERAGFIRIIPRSRPIVLDYTGFGIEKPLGEAIEARHITLPEIREFRTVVEGEMAAWAASRRSDEDMQHLHNCIMEMKESVNDYMHFLDLDTQFHAIVAKASKNRTCEIILASISEISREFTRRDLEQYSQRGRRSRCMHIYELHYSIYEKILERDVSGARSAMLYHLTVFEKDLVSNEEKRRRKAAQHPAAE